MMFFPIQNLYIYIYYIYTQPLEKWCLSLVHVLQLSVSTTWIHCDQNCTTNGNLASEHGYMPRIMSHGLPNLCKTTKTSQTFKNIQKQNAPQIQLVPSPSNALSFGAPQKGNHSGFWLLFFSQTCPPTARQTENRKAWLEQCILFHGCGALFGYINQPTNTKQHTNIMWVGGAMVTFPCATHHTASQIF